jgi:hypothetical protein
MVARRALECANIAEDRPEGLRCERHRPIAVRTSWCGHEDRSELTGGEISQRERGQPHKVPNTHQKDHLPLFPCPKRTFPQLSADAPFRSIRNVEAVNEFCRNSIGYRATLAFALRLPTGPGIPMQVVVPSVSLAATLQPTALTDCVETPSAATLFKPVSDSEISGPPTWGAAPAVGGIMAGGGAPVSGGVCCANVTEETSASDAATEREIDRIEASLLRNNEFQRQKVPASTQAAVILLMRTPSSNLAVAQRRNRCPRRTAA